MNRIIIAVMLVVSAWTIRADQILLRSADGKAHGPFEVRNGEKIVLKGEEFKVEVTTRTAGQSKSEEKPSNTPVNWHTATSPEVEAMKKHQVCIIPFGCLERHADHLPTGCDGLVAQRFAELAAEREPCLVLPPFYYAILFAGRNSSGTVGIPTTIFLPFLESICDDVSRNGFKKIILLNAHGGNGATLNTFLHTIADKGKDYAVFLPPLWLCDSTLKKVKTTSVSGHACEIETSIALHLFPEYVHKDAIPALLSKSLKDYDVGPAATQIDWYGSFPDQYAGDARAATAEKGKQIVEAQVDGLVDVIKKVKNDTRVLELLKQYNKEMADPRGNADELNHGRRKSEK